MPTATPQPTAEVQAALDYLGIDYADAKIIANVSSALNAAKATLRGAVGADVETYLPADPRIQQLVHIYTDDLYSDRGVSAKVSGATRRMVSDMEWQLRLELRLAKEAADDAEDTDEDTEATDEGTEDTDEDTEGADA